MTRIFHIPGIIFLIVAFVLLFLVSISLPFLTPLDFARVHFTSGSPFIGNNGGSVDQLRVSTFSAFCFYDDLGERVCSPAGGAYSSTVFNNEAHDTAVTVGATWTRGLAVHPVAAGVTFIALMLSFSTHVTMTLLASLIAFLASLLTLIAFAIDIALFVYVKHQMKKLDGVIANTDTGPGFWMTFVSFILLCLAGCTVCFGRRRDRMSDATVYPAVSKLSWKDKLRARFRR
ncbi:hypothetical protein QCA50_019855 [Cerrena zonata]|uniref:Pali-domain-containing protein n=1 Tax=Cerrena zonata TaxID=2478898 RepID=A0AAW0FIG2_9APHY